MKRAKQIFDQLNALQSEVSEDSSVNDIMEDFRSFLSSIHSGYQSS